MKRLTVKIDDENYIPRALCGIGRDGEVDDYDGCADYCECSCEGECNEYTLTPEKTVQSKIVEVLAQAFPKMPRDYCPECMAEIKDFIKTKNESEKEAAENEPE